MLVIIKNTDIEAQYQSVQPSLLALCTPAVGSDFCYNNGSGHTPKAKTTIEKAWAKVASLTIEKEAQTFTIDGKKFRVVFDFISQKNVLNEVEKSRNKEIGSKSASELPTVAQPKIEKKNHENTDTHQSNIGGAEISYCEQRLNELGISGEENKGTFMPTEHDDIEISYLYENGMPMTYLKERNVSTPMVGDTFTERFYRKRLKNPQGDMKYWQPAKSGMKPFLTAFFHYFIALNKAEEIQTLCLVEGEFKAFSGCKNGIACIGIGGIQNFGKTIKDEENKTIEVELLADIEDCIKLLPNLKNLVILHDADALNKSKDGTPKRQVDFYSSLKNFHLATKDLALNVVYSHIASEMQDKAKGLDDLLIMGSTNDCINDILLNFNELQTGKYFKFLPLNSEKNTKKLHKYFGLNEQKNVVSSKEKTQEKNFSSSGDESNRFLKIRNYLFTKYDFRMNIVSNDLLFSPKGEKKYEILNESDLHIELFEKGFKGFNIELGMLISSSSVEKYNPFKDYFDNLPTWNGIDHITHLASFVKAKNQDFFNYHFKKMLVRSVAQALEIIPFNKQCFTLIGKQNDGKTSFLRYLTPKKLEDYTKENLEFDNKDGRFALYQNLFINLDELANFSKYDINKSMF